MPVPADREAVVETGEIDFWRNDDASTIGPGPTPVSQGNEIRLGNPCNIWTQAAEDVVILAAAASADHITVEAID